MDRSDVSEISSTTSMESFLLSNILTKKYLQDLGYEKLAESDNDNGAPL
jgi:hypothetical protein